MASHSECGAGEEVDWDSLPQGVLEGIVSYLVNTGDYEAFKSIRCVSHAWNSATSIARLRAIPLVRKTCFVRKMMMTAVFFPIQLKNCFLTILTGV